MTQWYQIFKWPEENLRRIGYAAGGSRVASGESLSHPTG